MAIDMKLVAVNGMNSGSVNEGRSPSATAAATAELRDNSGTAVAKDALRQIGAVSGNELHASSTEPATKEVISDEELAQAVEQLRQFSDMNVKRQLEFKIDEDIDRVVVSVYDSESDELIRQIPSEEVLVLAKSLARNEGVLVKVTV